MISKNLLRKMCWDFPGGPLVKFHTLDVGGQGSIPDQGTRSHMP